MMPATPSAPSVPSAPYDRTALRERSWLFAVLFLLALLLLWSRLDSRFDIEAQERSRLAHQASAIEQNLVRQLGGVYAALRGMRQDLADWPDAARAPRARWQAQALAEAVPGLLTLQWLDAQGHVRASSRPAGLGTDASAQPCFRTVQQRPDPAVLFLCEPYQIEPDLYSLQLAIALLDAQGRFDGLLAATLDPAYFDKLLGSMRYAEDMRAALVHGTGRLIVINPPQPDLKGATLARAGSLFQRHLDSGRDQTVFAGTTLASGERRLLAQSTLRPPGLPLDQALVVAVSRRLDVLYAPWLRQSEWVGLLYGAFAIAAVLALRARQRQQRALAQMADERQTRAAAEAERLALALRGGDLALWDAQLPSGAGTVNARWYEMVGYRPGEIGTGPEGWQALVHPQDLPAVLDALAAHIQGRSPSYEAQYRLRHREGHWVWVLDRGRVVERDGEGQALRIVGTHMDISARVLAEQDLRDREAQLARITDVLPGPVARLDRQRRYLFASAAYRDWYGIEPEALLGRTCGEVLGPAIAALVWEPIGRALAGETLRFDISVPTQAGQRDAIVNLLPDREADGSVRGAFMVVTDISERKRAEAELRRTEARLRMASRLARLGDWRFDLQAQQFSFSPEACGMLGLDAAHRLSAGAGLDFVLPGHRERWRSKLLQALQDGLPFGDEVDVLGREGQPLRLQVLGEAVHDGAGRVLAVQGALQDVTEARRAQQQLRLLEAAVAGLNDMVVITEAEPMQEPGPPIVFVNDAFERLTGWRREEVLGRSPRMLQGPHTDTLELARIEALLAQGQPVRAEVVNHTRQGRPFWVDIAFVPLPDGQGKATHIVSVHRDIGERQRADAAVRSAQEELAATLAAIPDLLFDMDTEGRIYGHHSPRAELLYVPPDQFIGRRVGDVLPAVAAATVMRALRQAQAQGYSGGLQYMLPLAAGQRWFELSVASKAVRPGSLPRFIALARDVTERRLAEIERATLERQLREAQKLESIGTLAGGIAHDFNNILAAILGNVALAQGDLPPGHGALASLDQIQRAGLRARSLVQQILTFSRRQPNPLVVQPLQPMLAETLELLRATLPASVQVDCVLPPAPLWIEADATQMQQVLMNLCTNAWHALPEAGGRLGLGCEALASDAARRPGTAALKRGPCAHLWVRDDGVGIDAATLERIFDPFYTTKPVGQGTGLGLSVVHGIVRGHGGALAVDSTPGQGSTFHLYFPLADAPDASQSAQHEHPTVEAAGADQQVLYVDDDEVMLLMVRRLLQRAGYGVTACAQAEQALDCVRREPWRYELVISDYNMPGVSGVELAHRLARLRPGLPVIISSGYVTDELREQAAAAGVRALLCKENTLEELTALVQRVLEGGQRHPAGGG